MQFEAVAKKKKKKNNNNNKKKICDNITSPVFWYFPKCKIMTHHPVLDDMLKLGCQSQAKVAIAFQVYLNLSEAHTLWDVDYKYHEELNLIYLTGRKSKSAPLEIYIPMATKFDISITQLEALQNCLSKAVTLAIKDTDSTVVLYRIEKGLVPPETHEETKHKKQLKDQRYNVDSELRQNKEGIYMKAQGKDVPIMEETNDDESVSEEAAEDESFAGEL